MKFKVGDKVVPIDKTIMGGLETSGLWSKAKSKEQPFLYVIAIKKNLQTNRKFYMLSYDKDDFGGDYFNEDDLVPYQIDKNEAFKMLVNKTITPKQYEEIIRS